MKALRLHAYGQRPTLDAIDEPRITKPWDVIVRVGAAGLCRTDLHVMEGQWEKLQHPELPYVLGHENAGWVHEIGSAVTNLKIGDAVILHPLATCGLCAACRRGNDSHCSQSTFPGLDVHGGMAEYLLTNARAAVKLPDNLQPRDVAALADAGLTAYHAVKKASLLLYPGSHVVVIGAGGLGHIGIQLIAGMTTSTITVIDSSKSALDLAGQIGADHVVDASATADIVRQVVEITDGGAAVVLDFVGENGTEKYGPGLLHNGGSYFTIGYGGELELPTLTLVSREINIVGNLVGTHSELEELMALTSRGLVTLHTTVYPLVDFESAFADLETGRMVGRGILVP